MSTRCLTRKGDRTSSRRGSLGHACGQRDDERHLQDSETASRSQTYDEQCLEELQRADEIELLCIRCRRGRMVKNRGHAARTFAVPLENTEGRRRRRTGLSLSRRRRGRGAGLRAVHRA